MPVEDEVIFKNTKLMAKVPASSPAATKNVPTETVSKSGFLINAAGESKNAGASLDN